MQLLTTSDQLVNWRRQCGDPVHFVPTMGALHQGHQQLIQRAAAGLSDRPAAALVSVFVNPLQFGPGEDLARYPRDLERDAALAAEAGAAALWAPSPGMIYPEGVEQITQVHPPTALSEGLCGRRRPGHFDGVATVVVRLLALVRPARLLLGEKDWQQLVILRRVLADLGSTVVIESCATVRDPDGLACSSRNRYLTAAQREQALALPRALQGAASLVRGGERDPAVLVAAAAQQLAAAGLEPEYLELVEAHSLRPLQQLQGLALLAAAVPCGPSRLIDHLLFMSRAPIVAIDGPAGAGKSTVTKAFARRLGLVYLDTGAMYRALTWWVQHQGADPAQAAAVGPLLEGLDLQLRHTDAGEQQVLINGHDVSEPIRSPEVTAQVSVVAAHACVREALTGQQQAMGVRGGLVAEGRDIGTAVFPDAELKVFLTASVAERARRRAQDLQERGYAVPPLGELEGQIAQRDHLDSSRAVAPLLQAPDAVELITDGMAIETVIQALVDLFRSRVPEELWPSQRH